MVGDFINLDDLVIGGVQVSQIPCNTNTVFNAFAVKYDLFTVRFGNIQDDLDAGDIECKAVEPMSSYSSIFWRTSASVKGVPKTGVLISFSK